MVLLYLVEDVLANAVVLIHLLPDEVQLTRQLSILLRELGLHLHVRLLVQLQRFVLFFQHCTMLL